MDTKIYVADKSTFKELVQRLTGQQPAEAAVARGDTAPAATVADAGASAVRSSPWQTHCAVDGHWRPESAGVQADAVPAEAAHHQACASAGFALPSLSPWCSGGQCVLNMQAELPPPPPSPPSASTLAEEEMTTQEGKPDHMHQSPPKLLNLFPLTPSWSKNC